MAKTLHWARWLLLVPAYMGGLGVGPIILMILFRFLNVDFFQHLFAFFIVGSALASIGSSLLTAWVAPSTKLLVGILGAIATGVIGPTFFLIGQGDNKDTPLLALFLGYIGGALIAIVLLLLFKRNTQPVA